MSGVNFPQLCEDLGLPEAANLSSQEIGIDFVPASIVGLADGDLAVMHEQYDDSERLHLYGERWYNHGQVANKILQAALSNGLEQTPVYDYQGFAAEYFDTPGNPFANTLHRSAARIFPEVVTIDDNPIALPRPPKLVFDYGACLTSRSLIKDQVDIARKGQAPFTYSPLTRLHFTNRVLMQTYDRELGPGMTNTFIDKRFYIGREDGIASATDEIIDMQTQAVGHCEIADIIVCTGTDHTTREDVEKGMNNAYPLMREDGMLIIRGFAQPAASELGTDEIAAWAFEAGFGEQTTLEYSATSHNLGAMAIGRHSGIRAMKTVVLKKQ